VGCTGPGEQSDIIISNNVFNSVVLGASLGGANNKNITFSNNKVSGSNSSGNKYMIEVINGLQKGQIVNNVINITTPSVSGGIWLRDGKDVTISSNVISGVGYGHGIFADAPTSSYNVIISSNNLIDFSAGVSSGMNIKPLNSKI
jgi:hypothetical protein